MADETQGQGSNTGSGSGSQTAGSGGQTQTTQPNTGRIDIGDGKAEGYSPEELRTLYANIRQGEQAAKADARKLKDELTPLKERYQAEQPVEAKLQEKDARITELETTLNTVLLRGAATEAASKAGAIYPDAVVALINVKDVDRDKEGNPSNLGRLIEGVRSAYPAMFQARNGSADGGAGHGQQNTGGNDMNSAIRRMAGRSG